MKAVENAFKQYLLCIWKDFMMVACIIGPIIMGVAFRYVIPNLESYLCDYFNQSAILSPYYRVFDLLMLIMTPLLIAFAGVMVMLEEIDNNTAKYLCVTPIGPKGYLISRLGMPVLFSLLYDIILIMLCGISDMGLSIKLVLVVLAGIISILVSIMVVGIAKNKVEGMAIMKLSGLIVAAALLPFFSSARETYLAGVFPSFWMGKLVVYKNYSFVLLFIGTSTLWLLGLYHHFRKKLS